VAVAAAMSLAGLFLAVWEYRVATMRKMKITAIIISGLQILFMVYLVVGSMKWHQRMKKILEYKNQQIEKAKKTSEMTDKKQ